MVAKIQSRSGVADQLASLLRHQVLQNPVVVVTSKDDVELGRALSSLLKCPVSQFGDSRVGGEPCRMCSEIRGRDVLLVENDVRNGEAVLAALRSLRFHSPGRLLLVTPQITKYALERMRMELVDVVAIDVVKCLNRRIFLSASA